MLEEILKSTKLHELELSFKNNESVLIEDLWNTPKALVAALALQSTGKHILILTGASQDEVRLYQDLAFFTDHPILDFPAWETLPTENIAPSPDIVGERYRSLHALSSAKKPHNILSNHSEKF